ncbi:hypothetical protein [Carnobacterium sp. FSL E2-0243]|uniref:hypothetical protein n=1 Tax=Carnobacterium sp. FSL E2-0243 TaxID=2921365 RepID=UPI0030FCD0F0
MTILMILFALILFATAGFLLSGKASILIINEKENQHAANQHAANQVFFKSYGALLLLCGIFALVLIFIHSTWLLLLFLVATCAIMLLLILGLNRRID